MQLGILIKTSHSATLGQEMTAVTSQGHPWPRNLKKKPIKICMLITKNEAGMKTTQPSNKPLPFMPFLLTIND